MSRIDIISYKLSTALFCWPKRRRMLLLLYTKARTSSICVYTHTPGSIYTNFFNVPWWKLPSIWNRRIVVFLGDGHTIYQISNCSAQSLPGQYPPLTVTTNGRYVSSQSCCPSDDHGHDQSLESVGCCSIGIRISAVGCTFQRQLCL